MNLIVLTKKWGRNFTGATLATQYFVDKWKTYFDKIYVYTLNKGDGIVDDNVAVTLCNSEKDLCDNIKSLVGEIGQKEVIGYSDDHLGYLLDSCGVRYLHTYHGNWPDARKTDMVFFAKSFYFIPLYKKTIKRAAKVVNVSRYMEGFTDKISGGSTLIRNGIDVKIAEPSDAPKNKFLMVGNVDKRKYGKLINVLSALKKRNANIEIDIYGRIDDQKVANSLSEYNGVTLMGLCKEIPFKDYIGFINTSCIENLSISVCEALINEIPVVCFEVGGLPEVVKNGINGFVVEKFDAEVMAERIISVSNGYEFTDCKIENLSEFNWDHAAQRYIELFEDMR